MYNCKKKNLFLVNSILIFENRIQIQNTQDDNFVIKNQNKKNPFQDKWAINFQTLQIYWSGGKKSIVNPLVASKKLFRIKP